MKSIYKTSMLFAFLIKSIISYAQSPVEKETFTYSFLPNKNGAQAVYAGENHSFSLDFIGKDIKIATFKAKPENQNFIYIGSQVIQTSWVPLQMPLPAGYKVDKLNIDQQKEILEGYVNYELDYFRQQLHLKVNNLQSEWVQINSRPSLIWHFDFNLADQNTKNKAPLTKQVYISTICFNQVLNISIPFNKNVEYEADKESLKKIASTLKTYNKRIGVKI
jgi:hypothetical protein